MNEREKNEFIEHIRNAENYIARAAEMIEPGRAEPTLAKIDNQINWLRAIGCSQEAPACSPQNKKNSEKTR